MNQVSIDRLCGAVSAEHLMAHMQEFARRVKLSGTPEELESFRYLDRTMQGFDYATKLLSHDAYISLPGAARLDLGATSPRCITHSFSRSSPAGGLRGAVVHAGFASDADLAGIDIRGKIALIEGIASPGASARASRAGAIGQIHISPHEHIHEMCISPVWGSPDSDSVKALPSTVVVSISKADGDALKARLAGEAVTATLHADVDTRWVKTPILAAELYPEGAVDDRRS